MTKVNLKLEMYGPKGHGYYIYKNFFIESYMLNKDNAIIFPLDNKEEGIDDEPLVLVIDWLSKNFKESLVEVHFDFPVIVLETEEKDVIHKQLLDLGWTKKYINP